MDTAIEMKDLPLEPDTVVFVNGAALVRTKDGKLRVQASARVTRQEELITSAEQANTPTRRIYAVLQGMLLKPEKVVSLRRELLDLVYDRSEVTSLAPILKSLSLIVRLADQGEFQAAMEVCQRLIEFDEALASGFSGA